MATHPSIVIDRDTTGPAAPDGTTAGTTTTTTTHITTSTTTAPSTSTTKVKSPILVLGGTGTVGSRIAAQLAASHHPVVIASRSATSSSPSNSRSAGVASEPNRPANSTEKNENLHRVYFDWLDRSTWANPFNYISRLTKQQLEKEKSDPRAQPSPYSTTAAEREAMAQDSAQREEEEKKAWKIQSVYLIAPPGVMDAAGVMMDFVDFARRLPAPGFEDSTEGEGRDGGGVKRFVLQSASCIEPGGPAMGKVHGYFRELGSRGEIEWAVLRPSWFQQNFAVQDNHVQSIRDEGKIYSATGDGKIPWISADDIAAVAVQALTMPVAPNTEFLVLGPELLSYDDIASTLSDVLGKRIVHVDLTSSDLERRHRSFGMPEDYSSMMSALDTGIKYGMENRTNDLVLSVTGVAPKTFREYAESVKHVWQPSVVETVTPVEVVWTAA
ncbi:hypothetical protein V8F33_000233 [Rhypophila sp. PSN 637]